MKKHLNAFMLSLFLLMSVSALAQEYGFASYYSDRYQGRRTAYGDIYDKNKMTCSHKKHPYGTLLKVTRLDNDQSVVCKVIDKGPYTKGRIVDLSRAAAEDIGLIKEGVTRVKLEVYRINDTSTPVVAEKEKKPVAPPAARDNPQPKEFESSPPSRSSQESSQARQAQSSANTPPTQTEARTTREEPRQRTAPAEKPAMKADPNNLVGQDYKKYGLYKIQLQRGPQSGFGVQVMVVSDYESVMKAISSLQEQSFSNILVSVEKGQTQATLYKIILGPFASRPQAESYQSNLRSRYNIRGFVVDLTEKVNAGDSTNTND